MVAQRRGLLFVGATLLMSCGPSVQTTRLEPTWPTENPVLLVVESLETSSALEYRVLEPGAAVELELKADSTFRVWALAYDDEVSSTLARCGAGPEGDGLPLPRAKLAWSIFMDTRDGSNASEARFERAEAPAFVARYAKPECYPIDLAGIWEGTTRIRGAVGLPTRMEVAPGDTYNTAVVRLGRPAIGLPLELDRCIIDFTVTATRTGGSFVGRFQAVTCPGSACYRGPLGGQITETEVAGMFQIEEGLCTGLGGLMELTRLTVRR